MAAADPSPPVQSPNQPGLSSVVHRNIRSMVQVRQGEDARQNGSDHVAARVSAFAGNMTFVCVHAVLYGGWLIWNAIPGVPHWDPYPFVMLAMFASVESIFLSTFILITQNRMQKLADRRAELDLQISLLAEHELTRALRMIHKIVQHHGIDDEIDSDLEDAKRDVDPLKVVQEIERAEDLTPKECAS